MYTYIRGGGKERKDMISSRDTRGGMNEREEIQEHQYKKNK